MNYYKILIGDQIIDVNCVFLRWQARHGVMLICDAEDAQFITPRDGSAVWHPAWLHPVPEGAVYDGDIEAVEIGAEEYAELLARLETEGIVVLPEDPTDGGTEDIPQDPEFIPDGTIEAAKTTKKAILKKACNEQIVAGFTITLSDEQEHHFDLALEDQNNIIGLTLQVAAGASECDYYDSNGTCLTLSAADMTLLSSYATAYKSYHIAYYHCLCVWVDALEDIPSVAAVSYGNVVPESYRNAYLLKYATALGVTDYVAEAG